MADLTVTPPRGIQVAAATAGNAADGSSNEIEALMKRIAVLQKEIKKRTLDTSGDPRQKLEQLKLMQAELVLLNQALARLLDQQARQSKKHENKTAGASMAATAAESAPGPAKRGAAALTAHAVPAAQAVDPPAPASDTGTTINTYA